MVIALASLAACGGGGGGGGVAGTDPTLANGIGAKGIIKKGKVLVCRISGGKAQDDANCATGVTADDGSYNVPLTDGWKGPVVVKVLPATDGTTTMLDEITGKDVAFDVTDGIRAVVATASTPAHVTPFSEIAANAALKEATVDATAINNARAMVQANFGVDLTTKPVVDLKTSSTDAAELGKQIAMVQKLAQVVNASKTSGAFKDTNGNNCATVTCGIQAMNAMATSTTQVKVSAGTTLTTVFAAPVTVNVPIRKTDGTISVQAINPASSDDIKTKLGNAGLAADTASSLAPTIKSNVDKEVASTNTQLAELKNKTADNNGNSSYTPPSTTQLASMDQAKAMVNFLREALNRFSNTAQTGYLDKQSTRVDSEIQTVVRPDVERNLTRLKAMELGVRLYDKVQAGGLIGTVTSGDKTYYQTYSGSVGDALRQNGDYISCAIEKVSADQAKVPAVCRAFANGASWQPSSSIGSATSANSVVGTTRIIRMVISPQTNGSFNFEMMRQTVDITTLYGQPFNYYSYFIPIQTIKVPAGPYDYDATKGTNTYNPNCLTPGTLTYDTSKISRNSTSIGSTSGSSTCTAWVGTGTVERTKGSGDTWTALKITGTMPPSNPENTLVVGYDMVAMALSSTAVGASDMKYAISGSVAAYESAKTGTVEVDTSKVVTYALAEGSYAQATQTKDANGNVTSENANALSLNITFTGFNSKGVGILTASDWKLDKNKENNQPTKLVFDGTVSDTSTGGSGDVLKGKITMNRPNYDKIDSTKDIAYGNDDGATVNFEGGVYAKNSTDFIKTILAFSKAYKSTTTVPDENASIRFEIAGGFVLTGTGVSNTVKDQPGTIKLQNQDGLRIWALPNKDPVIYASDETTELGVYKSLSGNSGNKAFFFKDGSVISLN